jgi:hypothetical protein
MRVSESALDPASGKHVHSRIGWVVKEQELEDLAALFIPLQQTRPASRVSRRMEY